MSEGKRLQLATAHNLATRIRDSFTSVCEKMEIVGSIRRRRATVGDIEFVYIPRFQAAGQTSFLDTEAKTESLFDKAILTEIARRHPPRRL